MITRTVVTSKVRLTRGPSGWPQACSVSCCQPHPPFGTVNPACLEHALHEECPLHRCKYVFRAFRGSPNTNCHTARPGPNTPRPVQPHQPAMLETGPKQAAEAAPMYDNPPRHSKNQTKRNTPRAGHRFLGSIGNYRSAGVVKQEPNGGMLFPHYPGLGEKTGANMPERVTYRTAYIMDVGGWHSSLLGRL